MQDTSIPCNGPCCSGIEAGRRDLRSSSGSPPKAAEILPRAKFVEVADLPNRGPLSHRRLTSIKPPARNLGHNREGGQRCGNTLNESDLAAAHTLGEVPILKWSDPLPRRPSRILVAGAPGVGKSTLAQQIATRLTLPYVELDALHHGPQWQPKPTFRDEVVELAAQHEWVTEWQYRLARPLLAERADTLIFLDLPRWLVTSRIIRRTLRRARQRTELWNGLREPPLRTILNNPDHIVRWYELITSTRRACGHWPNIVLNSQSSGCLLDVSSKRGPVRSLGSVPSSGGTLGNRKGPRPQHRTTHRQPATAVGGVQAHRERPQDLHQPPHHRPRPPHRRTTAAAPAPPTRRPHGHRPPPSTAKHQ